MRCQAEGGVAPDDRQHLARPAAERDEVNALLVETVQVGIRGQPGVEHQLLGQGAGLLLPEGDETLDLSGLLGLGDPGPRITQDALAGVAR